MDGFDYSSFSSGSGPTSSGYTPTSSGGATPDTSSWQTVPGGTTVVHEHRTGTIPEAPPASYSPPAPSMPDWTPSSSGQSASGNLEFNFPQPPVNQGDVAPPLPVQRYEPPPYVPPRGEQQLYLSESKAFNFSVRATAAGRGFTRAHRAFARKLTGLFGGPKRYDLSHSDKSFNNLKQGELSQAGVEERSANRSRGASEREAGGLRSGNNQRDPNATPGEKNVQPKPPELKTTGNTPIKVGPGSATLNAIERIAGKAGSFLGAFFHVQAVSVLAKDMEMHKDPGSPSLGPIGTHRVDSTGTEWIKVGASEWVTKSYLDKST